MCENIKMCDSHFQRPLIKGLSVFSGGGGVGLLIIKELTISGTEATFSAANRQII